MCSESYGRFLTGPARNALTSTEIEPEVAGISMSRVERAPYVLLTTAAGTLLPAARFLIVDRERIEDFLGRRPLDNKGQFSIVLGRRLLITQIARIDGVLSFECTIGGWPMCLFGCVGQGKKDRYANNYQGFVHDVIARSTG
jgi:hypothetical protein